MMAFLQALESSDFSVAHADASADLAEVLDLMGRPQEAAEALRRAVALYEAKGNVLAAATARERVRELSGGG